MTELSRKSYYAYKNNEEIADLFIKTCIEMT